MAVSTTSGKAANNQTYKTHSCWRHGMGAVAQISQ
jgi:hypothetical protein